MSTHYSSSYYKGSFHKTLAELPKTVIPPPKGRMRCRMGALRLMDVLKVILGIAFGYALRMFSAGRERQAACQACPQCPLISSELEIITSDDQQQLREQFKPRNRFEVLRFEYFNGSVMFENFDDGPKRGILGHQKSDIKDIIAQTLALFNTGKPQPWTMKRILNGYRRLDPLRGEEYILDLEVISKANQFQETKLTMSEIHRFQMVKPFSVAQMITNQLIDERKMIHFIVPITYDIDHRLLSFLSTLEEVCLKSRDNIYLMVVLFTGQTDTTKAKAENVRNQIQNLGRRYPGAHIRIIQTGQPFNRATGLDLGAKQLPPESLLFFTDVDIIWTKEFLSRCRLNAIQGQQVYYPVVFAQYNPHMVLRYSPKDEIKSGLKDINKHTGHWVYYGFGMACMYNYDYRSVGGFNLEREGWGGEDVELHNKHVLSNLSVFRATDPGLIHIYHNKTCSLSLTADQMRMCVGSMANGYASKAQLGIHLLMPQAKLQSVHNRI